MKSLTCLTLTLAIFACTSAPADETPAAKAEETKVAKKKENTNVYDIPVKTLEGEALDLKKYKGKVLLVVNVASRCGATPQYTQLQAMHEKYSEKGLVVVGVPCNQFGGQEPGSSKDIREFCTTRYDVKFPILEKVDVNGDDRSKLYSYLIDNAEDHSDIGWNFEKFIVNKEGKVAGRFSTRTKPDAPEVVKLLEEELDK